MRSTRSLVMRSVLLLAVLSSGVLGPAGAAAFEFFDGRLEIHGFFETQLRTIARDFRANDDYDLTQWYNIINVEIEADIAPDGFGPFDLIQAFARVEARYDCVWRRACGTASSANVYGNRARSQPKRLNDGRRAGFRSTGNVFNGDQRRFRNIRREFLPFQFSRSDITTIESDRRPDERSVVSKLFNIQGLDTLYDNVGVDGIFGTEDDPAPFYFRQQEKNCLFNFRDRGGSLAGRGTQVLGPWNMNCRIEPIAALAGKPDPLSNQDFNPITGGFGGPPTPPLPLRPQAKNRATNVGAVEFNSSRPLVSRMESQGVYFPNENLARIVNEFDSFDQNFSQNEMQWNRGASQQDEKELKEAYLDLELFDSRLWIRAGRQQIVWGKTELFRNQDQWNPQDLALASLPSLEESRISQWAMRGVWSFYEVGPFEDVRLEVAMLWNKFEPADIGRCGEPYTPNPACNKTFGLFIHGLTGFGVAGEIRPQDPWENLSGSEIGARLEWRWNRFSFALTNYYGYTDFAFQDQIYVYSRNVDSLTGRPLIGLATGGCNEQVFQAGPVVQTNPGGPQRYTPGSVQNPNCLTPENALERTGVNQQLFRLICATSIGFIDLDLEACGQSVFNSQRDLVTNLPALNPVTDLTIAGFVSNLLVGAPATAGFSALLAGPAYFPTLVQLNQDPCDGLLEDCATPADGLFDATGAPIAFPQPGNQEDINTPHLIFSGGGTFGMNNTLTQQQKALLGCGEFYGTNCEVNGIDLMNAEASAIAQSWPGTEGTGISGVGDGDTFDDTIPQPGTVGFLRFRGPVATRAVPGGPGGSRLRILPGARGANDRSRGGDDDPSYDPFLDGCTGPTVGSPSGCNAGDPVPVGSVSDPNGDGFRDADANVLSHPFTGQEFANEFAALSWNFLMTLVAFSQPDDDLNPTLADYVQSDPFRTDGCSFRKVQFCSSVQAFIQVTGVQRNLVRAGGNGRFGRRDFVWHGGKDVALRYEKRNVLGFSADFAEDRTKSNWSFEFTWQDDLTFANNNKADGVSTGIDTYNLTISVDRPTFVNFLNANRTFFFNAQLFTQYVSGYKDGFLTNGPWNFLGVFIVQTGYFDDRLLPRMTFVYDQQSNSGAWLPQVTYRFTSDFSATVGMAVFAGREQRRDMALNPVNLTNRTGKSAYDDRVENGLSAVRDRDEIFLRIRYAF